MTRRQLYKYKGDCWAHCNLTVQEMIDRYNTFNRMFEFNHIEPKQKHPDYNNLIRRIISIDQLDEIDKCILLCRECHGIIHAQNLSAELEVKVKIGHEEAVQRFKGQMIIDQIESKGKFLTNERVLVIPYHVKIGSNEPIIKFGTQLEQDDWLIDHIKNLKKNKSIEVRSWANSEVLMVAKHVDGNLVKIQHSIRFPIFNSELYDTKGSPEYFIRNGICLSKKGDVIRKGSVIYEMEFT